MSTSLANFLRLLLFVAAVNAISGRNELDPVQTAHSAPAVLHSIEWARGLKMAHADSGSIGVAVGDCVKLYEEAEPRLARLMAGERCNCSQDDAVTWLSAVLASHNSCLDGLKEKWWPLDGGEAENLRAALREALPARRLGSRSIGKRKGELL